MQATGLRNREEPLRKRFMSTIDRAIADENAELLLRRWKIAGDDSNRHPSIVNRWFPDQRDLFELLSVMSEEQVLDMADCKTPLFNFRLPVGLTDLHFVPVHPKDPFEMECFLECYTAALTRLDAIRVSVGEACCVYGLTQTEANFIARFTTGELKNLMADQRVAVAPSPSNEYFLLAGMTPMTKKDRTVLAATSRVRA